MCFGEWKYIDSLHTPADGFFMIQLHHGVAPELVPTKKLIYMVSWITNKGIFAQCKTPINISGEGGVSMVVVEEEKASYLPNHPCTPLPMMIFVFQYRIEPQSSTHDWAMQGALHRNE